MKLGTRSSELEAILDVRLDLHGFQCSKHEVTRSTKIHKGASSA